jgi:hypothetical protein
MNLTVTPSTPTNCLLQFTLQSNTMVASLYPYTGTRDDKAVISETYLPGTRMEEFKPTLGLTHAGAVMDIQFDLSLSPQYHIIFDDGTACSILSQEMPSLISKPVTSVSDTSHLLPPFLNIGSKITFEHKGQFHKGFLSKTPEGIYYFSYKSHINKKKKDWGVNISPTTWQDLCINGILLPGHQSSLFLWSHKPPPSANFVSALNFKREYLRSLLVALDITHPNQHI